MKTTTPALAADSGGEDTTDFTWGTVPASVRDWLKGRTLDIVGLAYRGACDAVKIGVALEEAKSRLKHGTYQKWVESQLPFSIPTEKRYRQVAKAFASFQMAHFELFDESALYALAQLNTPQPVREHAVMLANDGKKITRALALEIIDAHRAVEEPGNKEAKVVLADMDEIREWEAEDRAECKEGDPSPKEAILRCRELDMLASTCDFIRIERLDDTDNEHDDLYSVTCRSAGDAGEIRNAIRASAWLAISELSGLERMKRCPQCNEGRGEYKKLSCFGINSRENDGLSRWCRDCSKSKKRAEKQRAREKKRQAPPSDNLAA